MSLDLATHLMVEALKTVALLAGPVLLVGLVVGLAVGLFQAMTQVHEMTLTVIPKLLATALVLFALGSWMLRTLVDFTRELLTSFPGYLG